MSIGTKTDQKTTKANRHVVVGAQSNDHSALLAGVPTERFFTDAATFNRAQLLATEYYEFDSPSIFWDVYNIEAMRKEVDIPDLLMDGRDAWASPPMISLDMMDEYVVAYTDN